MTRFVFLRYDRRVLSPRSLGTAMYVDLAEIGPLLPFNWITVAFLSSILSRGQGEILLTRLLAISSALFDAISIKREIKATPTRHYHVTPWLLLASSPFLSRHPIRVPSAPPFRPALAYALSSERAGYDVSNMQHWMRYGGCAKEPGYNGGYG